MSSMLDHFLFAVPPEKFQEVVAWYLAALAPLKYEKLADYGVVVGLGVNGKADLWIHSVSEDSPKTGYFHLGFKATDYETVHAFYEAAVKAGGKPNGEPGPRPQYGPNYYGAFVLDPVGNNIEAVDKTVH
ncbi:glyoxalase family protein [Neohortaea acidophila]|uniref:Glyoxalase family protein n=1 Tax=Neohortaea acidophila TaxID=245834 RepID=A0A6A6Q0P7_9PEZI|nr:glyoxalase family protein [Neohortaea acidophila]KAF2485263.1 glyoxalase family protein [Neohortaea acidophila]